MHLRRLLLVLLLSVLAWPGQAANLDLARPAAVGLSEERLERIRAVLRNHVEEGRIAGAVALLARRGKVAFFESFGDRDLERDTPMSDDTIFRIASMSKPITSVAVMMLFERGQILLSDPVSLYLPEFRGLEVASVQSVTQGPSTGIATVPTQREMTIQDLLRHTSGLAYGFFSDSQVDQLYRAEEVLSGDATIAETVTKLGTLPLKHQPGSTWEYSLSIEVLGRLVEVVSGLSFDRFLEEQIFSPLDMTDTGFHVAKPALPRVATGVGFSAAC